MNMILLTVGKTDVKWVKEGLDLYVSRLKHYVPFSVVEIPELKKVSSLTHQQIKEKEGELILKQVGPSDTLVLMDEHGREYRSLEFAEFIEKQMASGAKNVIFTIGGAYGFSEEVYQRANLKISLEVPLHIQPTRGNNKAFRSDSGARLCNNLQRTVAGFKQCNILSAKGCILWH